MGPRLTMFCLLHTKKHNPDPLSCEEFTMTISLCIHMLDWLLISPYLQSYIEHQAKYCETDESIIWGLCNLFVRNCAQVAGCTSLKVHGVNFLAVSSGPRRTVYWAVFAEFSKMVSCEVFDINDRRKLWNWHSTTWRGKSFSNGR